MRNNYFIYFFFFIFFIIIHSIVLFSNIVLFIIWSRLILFILASRIPSIRSSWKIPYKKKISFKTEWRLKVDHYIMVIHIIQESYYPLTDLDYITTFVIRNIIRNASFPFTICNIQAVNIRQSRCTMTIISNHNNVLLRFTPAPS